MKFKLLKHQQSGVALATFILLVFCIVLGGASRQHALRLAVVELAALPLLLLAIGGLWRPEVWKNHRFALTLLGALLALPLIQMIPLPPAVWQALPGRGDMTLALDLIGVQPGWAPLSMTPEATSRAFLALMPPAAMFLAVLALPPTSRLSLMGAVLLAGLASIVLGVIQIASGSDRLNPWETTDAGNMVGFFANRNHLATLTLTTIPIASALAGGALRSGSRVPRSLLWIAVAYIALAVVAIGVIRSRAGVILLPPALVLGLLAAWIGSKIRRPDVIALSATAIGGFACLALAVFALAPALERFDSSGAVEGRFENWPIVAEAAETYMPVGSGIGSFDSVYRSIEPLSRLDPTYFNQAHNDYLEAFLESGLFGPALALAFVIWWGLRSWKAWRAPPTVESDTQRAASIAILIILLHSAVDYPLRTETMAVLLALFAGLLEWARASPERRRANF